MENNGTKRVFLFGSEIVEMLQKINILLIPSRNPTSSSHSEEKT